MEYGLIGEKLGHSFSKTVHNEICDYDYDLVELNSDEFCSFMEEKDFKAINVTIPYKEKVLPYLDYIDGNAQKIGAVNTIVKKEDKLYGFNTDFLGLKALIEKNNITLKDKKVLILGSGGTSKTATAVAEYLGASKILKVSRREMTGYITYNAALENHIDADVIINTTPCGMFPNIGESAICIDKFQNLSAVVDAIYNPLNSLLLLKAREKGIKAVGGLYMLIAQAVFAAEKFTDRKIDTAVIDSIYNKILKEKMNLVLIGMPSCGKTTVGKRLAKELDKEFIDCDKEIERFTGKSIPEIFTESGETEFRKIESEVIKNIAKKQNAVIATGGGAILNNRNIEFLRANGFIVFLDRPLDLLITTDDRPLSSNRELLQKRYKERYDIYCKACDARIDASQSLEENKKQTKEVFLNENFSS